MIDSPDRLHCWLGAAQRQSELGAGVRILSLEAEEAIDQDADELAPERAADMRLDEYGYDSESEGFGYFDDGDGDSFEEEAFETERERLLRSFAAALGKLFPLLTGGVRLVASDTLDYFNRLHGPSFELPRSCDTLRLRGARLHNAERPLGGLVVTPGLSRLSVGGRFSTPEIDIGPALAAITHLNALVGTTLRTVPADCPLVSLDFAFTSIDYLPAIYVISSLRRLRFLALRFRYGFSSTMSTTTMSGDFGAAWRALGAASADRVLFAYAREDADPYDLYTPRDDTRPPLSGLVAGLADSLAATFRFRVLVVEAATTDLEEASVALTRLRSACEAIDVSLEVDASG